MRLIIFLVMFFRLAVAVENGSPLPPQWNNTSAIVKISSGERGINIATCSGVLISRKIVLTAAHCFYDMPMLRRVKIENLEAGWHITSTFRILIKSGYQPSFHDKTVFGDTGYDLGLLILGREVPNDFPKVELADSERNFNALIPNIWLFGTGDQRPYYSSAASLPLKDIRKISFTGKPEFYYYQSAKPSAGPCEGDSGGGVLAWENDRWLLVGIQSAKLKGPDCRDESNRGYFVPVHSNLDWIQAAVKAIK